MKNILFTIGLVFFASGVFAQEPSSPPKPPDMAERLRKTNEVLQKELQLTAVQKTAIEQAFKAFFTAADQLRKDHAPPPPPPPDPKVKEAMDKLIQERDESIKRVLSSSQFEKYKEVSKKLHPPRHGEKGKDGPPPPPPASK